MSLFWVNIDEFYVYWNCVSYNTKRLKPSVGARAAHMCEAVIIYIQYYGSYSWNVYSEKLRTFNDFLQCDYKVMWSTIPSPSSLL